jgi:hypothetical protein
MKRSLAAIAVVVCASVALHADVTIKSTISVQGGPPGASGAGPMDMVMQIKGMKSRTAMTMMGQETVILADLAGRKVYMLNVGAKTVQELSPTSEAAAKAAGAVGNLDAAITPTGQKRAMNSMTCEEYALEMTMSMAEAAGSQMPAEAAEMMKGLNMAIAGSVWVSRQGPGAEEYAAFSKAAIDANLASLLSGAAGARNPGMEKLIAASSQAQGLPCLTEMTMTVEGSGPMADMMKQAGPVKTSVKTTSITTDPLAADLFEVPASYTKVTK